MLQIYDGMTEDDPLIGTYCGSNIPPLIISVSNVLFVRFYSDVSVSGAGFNATYTQIDGKYINNLPLPGSEIIKLFSEVRLQFH